MHILKDPSFFFTNNASAPHGELLVLIKPLSSKSLTLAFNSFNSSRAIRYGRIVIGLASGIKSIPKSISYLGGIQERSLGKKSRNSLTTGTNLMGGILESRSSTLTIWHRQPLEIIFHAFIQEMIRPLGIEFSPFHSITSSFTKLNITTHVLLSIEAKKACNTSIPSKT